MRRVAALLAVLSHAGCVAGMYKSTAMTTAIVQRTDEMTGTTWVRPELAALPGAGYYLYFGVEAGGRTLPIRAVFETWNEQWVFAERVLVKADDRLFQIDIPQHEWQTGVESGVYLGSGVSIPPFCRERSDVALETDHPAVLAAICAAQRVTVRFVGRHRESTLNPDAGRFLEAARAVCAAHAARGTPR